MPQIILHVFGIIFIAIGIANIWLVHIVPGLIYLILSLIYLPIVPNFWHHSFNPHLPFIIKLAFGLVVLWGTLAITDLAQILGL